MRRVTVVERGRDGSVRYADGLRSLEGYWEFGGGDVVSIVSMGSADEWAHAHGWALADRAAILRFVADEVVRQRAPGCTTEIDATSGVILVRRSEHSARVVAAAAQTAAARADAQRFVHRFRDVREKFATAAFGILLVVGAVLWFGKSFLTVAPASGVPLGVVVRTETHIVSLIQSTDPHLPRVTGRGGDDTTSVSVLLVPLNGDEPEVVPIVAEQPSSAFTFARVFGSDGQTLWLDVAGLYGVREDDHTLVTTDDLREANPTLEPSWWADQRSMDIVAGKLHIVRSDRSAAVNVEPRSLRAEPATPVVTASQFERHSPSDVLAAGFRTPAGGWLGLHTAEEFANHFSVRESVRAVEPLVDERRRARQLYSGELGEPMARGYFRIRRNAPVTDAEYVEAAFLRMSDSTEPVRLAEPDSTLMIFDSAPDANATLVVARVDYTGKLLWRVDTGLDRFALQQILPGNDAFAFVGTRPPIPDKLSEPLVVLVDNRTGKLSSHSLWR